jgi:2-amino-4-hydroxy-6-hydroxymethyldihydropteridine diphosphokinase
MTIVYLALGSNLGDRSANLRAALDGLDPEVQILSESSIYETAPWGITEQPFFLNMAVKAETSVSPRALLRYLKRLEARLGRVAGLRYGPRKIDLDILFYDELIMKGETLVIPHPRLHERAFVLAPLADVAADFIHPVLKKSVREMLADVDSSGVQKTNL